MAENEEKKGLSPKAKKIINLVVDVVCGIILIFAVIFAVSSIKSKASNYNGYTEIFGKSYLGVQSNSMEGDKSDNFSKGDVIVIKVVDIEDADNFKVGDIITFRTNEIVKDKYVLNTHRIIEVLVSENGNVNAYITHGDNVAEGLNETVLVKDVIGIYKGKASGIGYISNFMSTTAGFFVCVLLPTLIIVAIAATNLIIVIKKEKKAQTAAAEAEDAQKLDAEREKIRQELLAEMQSQNAAQPVPIPPVFEPVQIAPVEPAVQPSEPVQLAEPAPAEPAQSTPETNDPSKENPEE